MARDWAGEVADGCPLAAQSAKVVELCCLLVV